MDPNSVTLLTSLSEAGGLATFAWFLFNGLKTKIEALNRTVEIQKSTLDAMDKRVQETEKIGALYQKLVNELPDDIDKYKEVLRRLKDQVIAELEEANRRKDLLLAELTESRLDEIKKQEAILLELPDLRESLLLTVERLEARLSILDLFQPGTPLGELLKQVESRARIIQKSKLSIATSFSNLTNK